MTFDSQKIKAVPWLFIRWGMRIGKDLVREIAIALKTGKCSGSGVTVLFTCLITYLMQFIS